MEFVATKIDGVFIVKPRKFQDDRGFFCETFKASTFRTETGVELDFVQDNFSYSKYRGTYVGCTIKPRLLIKVSSLGVPVEKLRMLLLMLGQAP